MTNNENCMLPFCRNKGTIPGISYFLLTKNRYDSWLQALGIDPEKKEYSYSSRICSTHFDPNDIKITPRGRMLLTSRAIPKVNLGPNIQHRKDALSQKTELIYFPEVVLKTEIPDDEQEAESRRIPLSMH